MGRPILTLLMFQKFCREALTWRPLEHPNVLPFVGVDANSFPGYLCMISPWMEHGTLPDLRKRYGPWNIQIERRVRVRLSP